MGFGTYCLNCSNPTGKKGASIQRSKTIDELQSSSFLFILNTAGCTSSNFVNYFRHLTYSVGYLARKFDLELIPNDTVEMPEIAATNEKPASAFATAKVAIEAMIVQSKAGSDSDDFRCFHPNQKSACEKIMPRLGYVVA